MNEDRNPYQEGKRAGVHPALVVFGVIIGMWLLIALAVPSGRQKQATGPEISQVTTDDADAAPVMFKVQATMPDVNAVSLVVPSPVNGLGAKGAGEAGTTGAGAACMNAVVSALRMLGVEHFDMPTTPARVWAAMQEARRRA